MPPLKMRFLLSDYSHCFVGLMVFDDLKAESVKEEDDLFMRMFALSGVLVLPFISSVACCLFLTPCYSCAAQSAAITPEVFEAFWRKLFSAPQEEELEIGKPRPFALIIRRRQDQLCSAGERRLSGGHRASPAKKSNRFLLSTDQPLFVLSSRADSSAAIGYDGLSETCGHYTVKQRPRVHGPVSVSCSVCVLAEL
jgi:hypothetical protein